MCQGLTRSYGGLLACRFIMGILEAALPPGEYRGVLWSFTNLSFFSGAALLIGQYYKRSEFYIRFSYFICFALLGSAFSGVGYTPAFKRFSAKHHSFSHTPLNT
jgi:hypothetical protein